MAVLSLAQAVTDILSERWHRGNRAIDTTFIGEQLAASGHPVPQTDLEHLLESWEAKKWVRSAAVHELGSARRRAKTIIWISDVLLV